MPEWKLGAAAEEASQDPAVKSEATNLIEEKGGACNLGSCTERHGDRAMGLYAVLPTPTDLCMSASGGISSMLRAGYLGPSKDG